MLRKPGRPRGRELDGRAEAHLVGSLAPSRRRAGSTGPCGTWPTGDGRAGLREMHSPTNPFAERSKNCLKPHLKHQLVITPRKSAPFVWRMEGF
jgi:hypothetical protein